VGSPALAAVPPRPELLRPPRVGVGDKVAVVATAGVVPPSRLNAGIARLESWGLRVHVGEHVLDVETSLSYLAGSDAERAADFTAAWTDAEVAAVMLARGGYGTQRLIELLDWELLASAQPKILVGFSDATALHSAVAGRLGLVTVHSHVVTSLGGAATASAEALRVLLMQPESVGDLLAGSPVRVVTPGRVTGVLVGGNLALLASEVGTPFWRPARDAIVVLEDVLETPYRIDRLLTQLLRAGWFEGARGVVLGSFTECGDAAEVEAVLVDRLCPLGVPILAGLDFGHTHTSATIPLGVQATLDTADPSLRLEQPPLA